MRRVISMLKAVASLLKEAAKEWSNDKASRLGAALAYYSIFSLGPLLLLLTVVIGLVFGAEATSGELEKRLTDALGPRGAAAVQSLVASAYEPKSGAVATIVGVGGLLFAATNIVIQLKDALNAIWSVEPKDTGGVRGVLSRYGGAVVAMLAVGILLVGLMATSAAIGAAGRLAAGVLPIPSVVLQAIDLLVSFGLLTVLFAAMYKWLPDADVAWKDVWIGGVATSLLFVIGKFAIGLYLGRSGMASAYGAAGSLVFLLLWIYYSAQVLFFGAELAEAYSRRFGSRRGETRKSRPRAGPATTEGAPPAPPPEGRRPIKTPAGVVW